jgi:hypothetical protein
MGLLSQARQKTTAPATARPFVIPGIPPESKVQREARITKQRVAKPEELTQGPKPGLLSRLASKLPKPIRNIGTNLKEAFIGRGQDVDFAGELKEDTGFVGAFRPLGLGKTKFEKVFGRIEELKNKGISSERANKIGAIFGDTSQGLLSNMKQKESLKKLNLSDTERKVLRKVGFFEKAESALGALDLGPLAGVLKKTGKIVPKILKEIELTNKAVPGNTPSKVATNPSIAKPQPQGLLARAKTPAESRAAQVFEPQPQPKGLLARAPKAPETKASGQSFDEFVKAQGIFKGNQITKEAKQLGSDQGGLSDFTLNKIKNEDYISQEISIKDLRKADPDLDDYLKTSKVREYEGEPFGMDPIVSSNGEVLDGYNRVAQAIEDGKETVTILKGKTKSKLKAERDNANQTKPFKETTTVTTPDEAVKLVVPVKPETVKAETKSFGDFYNQLESDVLKEDLTTLRNTFVNFKNGEDFSRIYEIASRAGKVSTESFDPRTVKLVDDIVEKGVDGFNFVELGKEAGLDIKDPFGSDFFDTFKKKFDEEVLSPKELAQIAKEKARILREIQQETLSDSPAKILNVHFGKSSDTIGQQLENAKGTPRARFIEDKVSELGYDSVDDAQKALDSYKESRIQQAAPKPLKFSAEGRPLALNARERAIVSESKVPKARLLDTTTGEGRSLEKLALQEESVKTPKWVPEKDVSLYNIIQKEPTPVKQKVGSLEVLRTPDRVFEEIGLDKEFRILREQSEKYQKELPKNIEKIKEWVKGASPSGNESIFRWLDGEAIDLIPADKKIATEIKKWLEEWADRLGLPKDERIANYITHIFDAELIAKEFPEELAKLIRDKVPGEVYDPFLQKRLGALGYKKDTWAALDAYVKRATRKVYMDSALKGMKDMSSRLEKTQLKFVEKYLNDLNMRPNELDEALDITLKKVIGYKLGQRPTLTITRVLRKLTYTAFLGGNPASALKNLSQGANTYAVLGEKYTTLGYVKLFNKGAKQEIIDEGVLNNGFIQDKILSSTKQFLEKADKVLFSIFETAEHINRGAAYFGAKAQFLSGKASPQEIKRALGRTLEEVNGQTVFTERDAVEYGKHIVRKTQFAFGKIDTPRVFASDIAKTFGQLQSYSLKQSEFLIEMGIRSVKGDEKARNALGLLRYALGGLGFITAVGSAIGMKPEDLIPSFRLSDQDIKGIPVPPSLKLPVELINAATNAEDKYGNVPTGEQKLKNIGKASLGLIPAGTQMKKSVEGYQAMKAGKSEDKAGRAQFDVGGTPAKDLQAVVFGKYSGKEARDYFNKDITYAEATLEKLRKLSPEAKKEEWNKIVDENVSLARNIRKVAEDQKLGVTKEEKKIRNLGVENKARAKAVAKKINKVKDKDERLALYNDYIDKGIITKDVKAQLPEFVVKLK